MQYKRRPSYTENGQKHKKLFISAPERARAILSVFSDHLAYHTRGLMCLGHFAFSVFLV